MTIPRREILAWFAWAVATLIFLAIRQIPGDPAAAIKGRPASQACTEGGAAAPPVTPPHVASG